MGVYFTECGPAAQDVARLHVGALVGVGAHGDEVAVEERDHARVGERGLVEHVAPVAPHGGERQEDGAVARPRFGEGGIGKELPVDLGGAIGAR